MLGLFGKLKDNTVIKPKELKVEKKLGEGSFGIVYLGTFRGNKVAIKKINQGNDEAIVEFEKEVTILKKCQNSFIVHFYGAVFIRNKMCMVTEFAQFGSLLDLINTRKEDPIPMKIRIKIMIDSAKGIEYLHSNGILHRDIKPDNIIVMSLDDNEIVNAKLTGFESSRNVNALMTNFNMTVGVGKPAYMAPEVLKKDDYNCQADIYSFAITMYECFGWCECYPKDKFKHPWDIANFVSNGKRRLKQDNMTNEQYQFIENCWKHDPNERLKIDQVISELFLIEKQREANWKKCIEEEEKKENEQIEEWTSMKLGKLIFDSDIDDWKEGTSVFGERIMNRNNIIFIIEDEDGNKFGGYINTTIEKLNEYVNDPNAFIFSLKSNGRLNGMVKFDIKDKVKTFYLNDKSNERLFDFGGQSINVFKENKKNQSYSDQEEHDFGGIQKALCGKTSEERFKLKRIKVIQLDYLEEEEIKSFYYQQENQLKSKIEKIQKEKEEFEMEIILLQEVFDQQKDENSKKSKLIEDLRKIKEELEYENFKLKKGDLKVEKKQLENFFEVQIPISYFILSTPFVFHYDGYELSLSITPDTNDGDIFDYEIETIENKIKLNFVVCCLSDGVFQRDGLNLIVTLSYSKEHVGIKTLYSLQIGNREPIPLEFEIKEGIIYESNDQGLISSDGRKGYLKVIIQLV